MAKPTSARGSSCHIHSARSLARKATAFGEPTQKLFGHYLAGQLAACASSPCSSRPTSTPTSASPARLRRPDHGLGTGQPHLLLPAGRPRRGAAGRVPDPRRRRQPLPRPRALIAAGLHGIDNHLPLEPVFEGNAYKSDKPRVPHNIYEARDAFAASEMVAEAFGQEVVDHYLNRAAVEIDAFEAAVTDWERFRGFERL